MKTSFLALFVLVSLFALAQVPKNPTESSAGVKTTPAANIYEEEVSEAEAEKLLEDSGENLFNDEDVVAPVRETKATPQAAATATAVHAEERPASKSFPAAPKPRAGELIQGSAPLYPHPKK